MDLDKEYMNFGSQALARLEAYFESRNKILSPNKVSEIRGIMTKHHLWGIEYYKKYNEDIKILKEESLSNFERGKISIKSQQDRIKSIAKQYNESIISLFKFVRQNSSELDPLFVEYFEAWRKENNDIIDSWDKENSKDYVFPFLERILNDDVTKIFNYQTNTSQTVSGETSIFVSKMYKLMLDWEEEVVKGTAARLKATEDMAAKAKADLDNLRTQAQTDSSIGVQWLVFGLVIGAIGGSAITFAFMHMS